MKSQGIPRRNRASVIAASRVVTFLVTHKISDKQPWGGSYTSILCFHNSSFLAPRKSGRSHLMATFCSPTELVGYSFAARSLAIMQTASGINSSRSPTAPFPGRHQESNRLWGPWGGWLLTMYLGGVFNGPSVAKPWPVDGQLVGREVGSHSAPLLGLCSHPNLSTHHHSLDWKGPLETHLDDPKCAPWSKCDGFTIS